VEHGEVLRKMAAAMATVVPSRSEAFGLVNIESMAVGTPVVGSAVGGIVEIVRDGKDGFLVPPDDPSALATRLETVLTHPQLRRELSRRARERFLAEFEQSRSVREQADWQEALFGGNRPTASKQKMVHGTPA
jgi:glycosyltransferase involved in cell wall biosynthesis